MLHIFSSYARSVPVSPSITVGDIVVSPKTAVRDLGAVLDEKLTMRNHINTLCKSAYAALREIGSLRKYLNAETTERLIHAFVTSRLDQTNSLLYGLPQSEIRKLQQVQNTAARIVTRTKSGAHITPILRSLHWLPVRSRIHYKIVITVFKALNNLAPEYLRDLLQPSQTTRCLRSASKNLLFQPRTKTKTYGDRAFSAAGPRLWNELPHELRTETSLDVFKSNLKTYIFKKAYE